MDGAGASKEGAGGASKERAGGASKDGAGVVAGWPPGSPNSNPKSRSESDSGGAAAAAPDPGDDTGVGVPPNRSRNGESMSNVVSTVALRGRTGCGAWKTPTAPCPGAATNSSTGSAESDGE
jgi:hypothetical protein